MARFSWRSLFRSLATRGLTATRRRLPVKAHYRPQLEALEDRLVPAPAFTVRIDAHEADPARWTIRGDNDGNDRALFGTSFTSSWIQPVAGSNERIAQFRFAGDVTIHAGQPEF